jgi:hypothetical protein
MGGIGDGFRLRLHRDKVLHIGRSSISFEKKDRIHVFAACSLERSRSQEGKSCRSLGCALEKRTARRSFPRCTVVSGKDRFGKYVVEKQVEGGEEREVIYTSPAT